MSIYTHIILYSIVYIYIKEIDMRVLKEWYQTECESGNWIESIIIFIIKIMKIKL